MTIDKKAVGLEQELAMLHYLARFGWLTVSMCGELVFSRKSQKDALARRLLNKLAANKEAERHLDTGVGFWLLSRKGAKRLASEANLNREPLGVQKMGNMRHRAASNWRPINAIASGHQVWTEHEIQSGYAPFVDYQGKIPDGLIETEEGAIWIEVENAYKSRIEREKILTLCERNLSGDTKPEMATGCYLFRIEIVSTNKEPLAALYNDFLSSHERGYMAEAEASLVTHQGTKSAKAITSPARLAAICGTTYSLLINEQSPRQRRGDWHQKTSSIRNFPTTPICACVAHYPLSAS